MAGTITDDDLRRASTLVLIDDKRPGWGMAIPIPFPPDDGVMRQPITIRIDSQSPAEIDHWRQRVANLRPRGA